MTEPILTPSNDRFTFATITHPDIWSMYKAAEASFWTAEEFDAAGDREHWETLLTDDERYFIKNILAFFASADGIINENLCQNFSVEVQLYEARAFYGFQIAMENIHSETYGLLIDAYVTDRSEKARLVQALESIPCIAQKAAWAMRWMDASRSFATRLIAFAVVEGVFFSGAFCAIFWLKKRGLMPGLTFTNELISRDENLHCEFACLLYSKLIHRADEADVHAIIRSAVDIERQFVCESLPVRLIGMNSDLMSQYIEFVADRLAIRLGCGKLYGSVNPFEFMELQSMEGKTNFFERRVADYQKAGVLTERGFGRDDDF